MQIDFFFNLENVINSKPNSDSTYKYNPCTPSLTKTNSVVFYFFL